MNATSRSRLLTRAGVRAGVVVAALTTLTACGGIADDAPRDATTEDFCAAYLDFEASAEDVAARLAEVGTPTGISDAEREGFEAFTEGLNDEGGTARVDVQEVTVPGDDEADGKAFVAYADETCFDFVPDAPSDGTSPSESPTDSPSDTPSDSPSDSAG